MKVRSSQLSELSAGIPCRLVLRTHQAERVAAGICIDAEGLGAAGETRGAKPEDCGLPGIQVIDFHVHVHLLRVFSIGPLWLDELVHALEGDSRAAASPIEMKSASSCTRIIPSNS